MQFLLVVVLDYYWLSTRASYQSCNGSSIGGLQVPELASYQCICWTTIGILEPSLSATSITSSNAMDLLLVDY